MTIDKFSDFKLSEEILKTLKLLGYENPTNVQAEVIDLVLNNKDLIVKSQTGSGKTAAFGIPLCEKITIERTEPQALILTPTRELCVQIKEDIINIGRFKRVRCAAVFGRQPMKPQVLELKQRVHVVAGTPGRVLDHIKRGSVNFSGLRYLIIDEADKMLNMGFIDQVEAIIKQLPKNRTTMLFSATMPEEIEFICSKYMNSPVSIEIAPDCLISEKVRQELYEIDSTEKFNLLQDILIVESPESGIIFCRTKDNVDTLNMKLKDKQYSCEALHGGMLQNERLNIMNRFKRGEFKFLVATDIAARGIDIDGLDLIINYDVPVENESYVHRIGRTGRAGAGGKAVTFASPEEMRYLREIEEYIGHPITKKERPSIEEVEKAAGNLQKSNRNSKNLKRDKGEKINREVTKLYINAGKKKKLRAGDIVGTIISIDGVAGEDIGIINIQDNFSYIDILGGKGELVLSELQQRTIKGKKLRVEKADK